MDSARSAKPQASWRWDPHEATQGELQGEYTMHNGKQSFCFETTRQTVFSGKNTPGKNTQRNGLTKFTPEKLPLSVAGASSLATIVFTVTVSGRVDTGIPVTSERSQWPVCVFFYSLGSGAVTRR